MTKSYFKGPRGADHCVLRTQKKSLGKNDKRNTSVRCSATIGVVVQNFEDKGVAGVKLFKTGAKIVLGLGKIFPGEERKLSERFDRSREAK